VPDNYIYRHTEKEFKGKQSKTLLLNRIPASTDGKSGDFALHNTADGSNLYVKYNTKWWFVTRLAKAVGKSGKFDGRLPDGAFSKLITKEALRLPSHVSATPTIGDMYVNDSENEVRFYGSSGWQVLTGSSTTGKIITYTSESTEKPLVIIQNTTNDAESAEIRFIKDKGAAGADNDLSGKITFYADDAAQENRQMARIEGYVVEADDTSERGGLKLLVAPNADTTLESGLTMVGTPTTNEVDVTIANGTASLTTIGGNLYVRGGTIEGVDGGALTLKSDTDLIFQVDVDQGSIPGAERFQFKDGAGTEIASITEGGLLTASKGITVGADADGDDRMLKFGHSTNETVIGIDDSGDTFSIKANSSAFATQNDFEMNSSGVIKLKYLKVSVGSNDWWL